MTGWAPDGRAVVERVALCAAAAAGAYWLVRTLKQSAIEHLEKQLKETQDSLEHARDLRKADRTGRIRAEQELRAARIRLQQLQMAAGGRPAGEQGGQAAGAGGEAEADGQAGRAAEGAAEGGDAAASDGDQAVGAEAVGEGAGQDPKAAAAAAAALAAAGSSMSVFPFRPIGHLRSVFTERNGTPRQPLLVPAARSRLVLCSNVPADCLEGLTQYSHCWVLYVFHANTDLAKYLSPDRRSLKAKIHVPRLNGGRMGVLATRSPHRPSPIGLSTARVLAVEGNTVLLGGADIVDGSPVLDIKPYVPFCDAPLGATAPAWVQAEAEDEPLAVGQVVVGEAARAALERAWGARRSHSMYGSAEEFMQLVQQVLSRDIRSLHQRINLNPIKPAAEGAAAAAATASPAAAAAAANGTTASAPSATISQDVGRAGDAPTDAAAHSSSAEDGASGPATSATRGSAPGGQGKYHVVLENVYITYDIGPGGVVELVDAWVDSVTTRWWNS